ncbi:Gfo/Idh/MocA family protein [Roseiflexus sp.]|uniref:Gfo/Idh/MocA family protein n=1 Tax=Roseiflexus sp. TaxID=2562120 RepID=UPI0021DC82DF|nr:Gfo/Idh/MocA family oxidoreductase [Roseiflexus sp.]GIW00215.1 MAG: 1-carboxy-3-chloro-3,4-dihydroxycyclo hexa-1,5-diene dehydrogenase [Roseiflexus sp.]
MAAEIGIGLVGYGGIGRMHALCYQMLPLAYPNLAERARIVAVATASVASAERARRELGKHVLTTTDLGALLAHPAVTVVDCCAPTGDHARIAKAALAAGKALFCEKPLGATPDESARIVELARVNGLTGSVNFHLRFAPAIQEARRRVTGGLLGEVRGFHLRYYRSSNLRRDRAITWRFSGPGSGVLADLGSHMIDLTMHLLGPIRAVSARTATLITERPGANGVPSPVEGDDVAWLSLELINGGYGTIEVSKMVPGAGDDIRIEAYGSAGALIFDTRDPNGLEVIEGIGEIGGRRIATLSRTMPPATLPSPETPGGTLQWHLASIASFIDALYRGVSPEPTLTNGWLADCVIGAARQSAASGGAWIGVDED